MDAVSEFVMAVVSNFGLHGSLDRIDIADLHDSKQVLNCVVRFGAFSLRCSLVKEEKV